MMSRNFWSGKKILVIEGETQTRNFFLQGLQAEGFCAIAAEDGFFGMQQAQEQLPDLIVSEINVPKLDGYSILTKLRQNFATAIIPFIFVTVKATRNDIRKAMELGADDYLTKPCTLDELQKAIAACFRKRSILQHWYTRKSQPERQRTIQNNTAIACQVCTEQTPASHLRQHQTRAQINNFEPAFLPDSLISKVFSFIEANYHQQITLSDVAVAVGYSSTYLTNLVRRQTGQTVQNWIIERRMAAARSLLLETEETVEEIAIKIGYHSVAHFFRQFRQHHRTSPQAWKKKQLAAKQTTAKELLFISKDR